MRMEGVSLRSVKTGVFSDEKFRSRVFTNQNLGDFMRCSITKAWFSPLIYNKDIDRERQQDRFSKGEVERETERQRQTGRRKET